MTNVCNYADDTTFHVCDPELESLIQWFNASNWMVRKQLYETK